MCRLRCDPNRSRSIPTTISATGAASAAHAENLRELVRRGDLELIVSAVARPLVRAPALEDRRVAKPPPLHVVVLDLADALDSKGFPGEILARAPSALAPRHASHLTATSLGPLAPRMLLDGAFTERRQLHSKS